MSIPSISEISHQPPFNFSLRFFSILYWSWWVPFALLALIAGMFFSEGNYQYRLLLFTGFGLGTVLLLSAIIRGMVLFFRMWKVLEGLATKYQFGAEVSAGSAVGLMFVPFFDLYLGICGISWLGQTS